MLHDERTPPARWPAGRSGGDVGTSTENQDSPRTGVPFSIRLAQAQRMIDDAKAKPNIDERLDDMFRSAKHAMFESATAMANINPDRYQWRPAPHRNNSGQREIAYLVAGLISTERCEHVTADEWNVWPVRVTLGARRADCETCFDRYARSSGNGLWVPPNPVVADDRCDLCDEIAADGLFTPFKGTLGPYIIGGDLCTDCRNVLVGADPHEGCPDCDAVVSIEADQQPYTSSSGTKGVEVTVNNTTILHADDCAWYQQFETFKRRASNRAERRAALKRARRNRS